MCLYFGIGDLYVYDRNRVILINFFLNNFLIVVLSLYLIMVYMYILSIKESGLELYVDLS